MPHGSPKTDALPEPARVLRELATGRGAAGCGVHFGRAGTWDDGELRVITRSDLPTLRLAHDAQGAPYALDLYGNEELSLLVSLTDEGERCACVWAQLEAGTELRGIGVDLASSAEFSGARGERFNPLLFTERERTLVTEVWKDDEAFGFACAFSAKEAAFKACSAPLRRWYDTHDEQLIFGVPDFELIAPGCVAVRPDKPNTQRALELIGVREINVAHSAVDGLALTFGCSA